MSHNPKLSASNLSKKKTQKNEIKHRWGKIYRHNKPPTK